MSEIWVVVVCEDDLSAAVIARLLEFTSHRYRIKSCRVTSGFGQIKKNALAYNKAAVHQPFIVLTDLDTHPCAQALIRAWFLQQEIHRNLILRIAVREVEAWLLAGRASIAQFLGISGP